MTPIEPCCLGIGASMSALVCEFRPEAAMPIGVCALMVGAFTAVYYAGQVSR
jgi:hypothetical protein